MERKRIKEISKKLIKAKRLLEETGNTPFEGVHANIKRALISIDQALYDLGMEEKEGDPGDDKRSNYAGFK
jgi:hypothetical protein